MMNRLLGRKLRRDIIANPAQFTLMALAVFLSVFALMTLVGSLTSLQKATAQAYLGTNPAQATVETDGSQPLPDNFGLPGAATERRGSVLGRIADKQGNWHPFLIFVIDDFSAMHIGISYPDHGAWPPATGSVALERTALDLLNYPSGTRVKIILPGSAVTEILVSAAAHDPGLAPAWQERSAYGYMNLATARQLFGPNWQLAELKLAWDDPSLTAAQIRSKADQAASQLETLGYRIEEIQVPPPRMHPHQGQMNTILTIFMVFSGLALVLSGILLATMLRSLLIRETRSIGIMKSIGAAPAILIRHYLGLSLVPALVGTLLALPLGLLAASGLSEAIVGLLNFGNGRLEFAWGAVPIPLVAGLLIPGLFTLIPVVAAIRQNVRAALEGRRPQHPRTGEARLRLPVTLNLAIENLLRRKGSLALTLSLLASAGMIFMTALNITTGWEETLKQGAASKKYDLEIRLDQAVGQAEALQALRRLSGVKSVEAWPRIAAYPASQYRHPLTSQYPDRGHGSFSLRSMPNDSRLVQQTITQGKAWSSASPRTDRPIILNQNALALFPGARIGSSITLIVQGKPELFKLAALIQEIGASCAWVQPAEFPGNSTGPAGSLQANSFYLAYEPGALEPAVIAKSVENTLISLGGRVEMSLPESEFDSALGNHILILIVALAAMAVIIGLVGLLGLSATMGASVLDRTREIGIMRAIGAQPRRILALILGEATLQAIAGLILALALSWPATVLLGRIIGLMSFRIPLETSFNLTGILACAIVLPLGALLAAFGSARQAAKLSVRDGLSYE